MASVVRARGWRSLGRFERFVVLVRVLVGCATDTERPERCYADEHLTDPDNCGCDEPVPDGARCWNGAACATIGM